MKDSELLVREELRIQDLSNRIQEQNEWVDIIRSLLFSHYLFRDHSIDSNAVSF